MNSDIIIRNAKKDDAMDIADIIVKDWQIAYKNIIDRYNAGGSILDIMQAAIRRYSPFLDIEKLFLIPIFFSYQNTLQ